MAQEITALGSVSFGWLHQQGGFVFDEPFFCDPRRRRAVEDAIRVFVERRFPDDPVYNMEAHLVQPQGRRQPVALVGGLQPNLQLAAAMGARFVFYGHQDPDVELPGLSPCELPDRLAAFSPEQTWPFSLWMEQIEQLREAADNDAAVIPPFFWDTTGRATIHGVLTTAHKLIGDRIFLEMAGDGSFVDELFHAISRAYATLIARFSETARVAVTGLHYGECSLCMISPGQFERFVLPHLNWLADRLGPVRLHSCGRSDHLLESFAHVKRLASLNVGSGTSVPRVRELFGAVPVEVIPEIQLLASGRESDVDRWVREIVAQNGEGPLELQYHLDVGQPEANALQIHRTLAELGYPASRETVY